MRTIDSRSIQNLILNEPAGNCARIVVVSVPETISYFNFMILTLPAQKHTVTAIVKAWDDPSANVNQITKDILACL